MINELNEIEQNVLNYLDEKGIIVDVVYNGVFYDAPKGLNGWKYGRDHYLVSLAKRLKNGKIGKVFYISVFYDSVINSKNKPIGAGEELDLFYQKLKVSAMFSLFVDANVFHVYDGKLDFKGFCKEYDYEHEIENPETGRMIKNKESYEIFKACKNAYQKMKNKINLDELGELLQDY